MRKRRVCQLKSLTSIVIRKSSRAPLTIFDDPYLGLDAVARGVFYDRLLEDYKNRYAAIQNRVTPIAHM
jgi:ABC-2 type transport system ATP-binding protein